MSDRSLGASVLAVIIVIAMVVGIHAATYEAVPPDKIALHYTGGPIDGTHFESVIQPGTGSHLYGLSENIYKLPSTQRTYIVSKSAKQGDEQIADSISAPSKDRVSFTFEAVVYFKLNTNPKVLRQFFEQVCLHDKCYTDKGWNEMLRQYFRKPLELAIAQEAKNYDQAALYSDPETLTKLNQAVSSSLADDINAALGGPFFCGPDSTASKCGQFRVIIKNPTPPQSVIDAYDETSAATQKVRVAQQTADASVQASEGQAESKRKLAQGDADAQAIRAGAAALSPEQLAYIQAQALATCAANNNCTLVVNGSSGGVNINTKG